MIQLLGDYQLLLLLMPYFQAGDTSLGEKSTANVFSDGCTRIGEGESLIFEVGFLSLWREDGLDGLPCWAEEVGECPPSSQLELVAARPADSS